MQPFRYHVFACDQQKPDGAPCCRARGSEKTIGALRREVASQGLGDSVQITACGSIGLCENGPNLVVYPEGVWYSGVGSEDAAEIVEQHFRHGRPVERLMRRDEAATRAEIFARGLASPFGAARELWAPRYRQATFGAFLTDRADGTQALEAAYADVLAAFDHFAAHADPALPIVLVGHSQGALHLMKLMQQRVAGKPLAARIAAAYVVGWPVSLAHDLPEMGLPACTRSDEAGCVLSWQSFAEPADPSMVLDAYARLPGLDGKNRKGSPFLCINPITGRPGDAAEGWANIGTLVPDATLAHGALMPGLVPARCAPNGFLLVGPPPQMGPYVLPGNNYHVYDIPLFWANVRADVTRRVNSWQAAHRAPPTTAEGKTAAAETPAASRHARSWWPWRRG